MCGIIGARNWGENKEAVNPWVINQYEDQHRRGSEGFGVVMVKEDLTIEVRRSTEPVKFMFDLHHEACRFMIVHHRMPTSTDNKLRQTHPMYVIDGSLKYKYLVVHNGVISNARELRTQHINELGFTYMTDCAPLVTGGIERFNDSEAFAIEIARYIEGQTKEVGTLGSVAFIALQIDKKTDKAVGLFFGRNTNPLNMSKTRGKIRLSSEGEGNAIEAFQLYSADLADGEMKLKKKGLVFKKPTYAPATTSGVTNWTNKDGWVKKEDKKTKKPGVVIHVDPSKTVKRGKQTEMGFKYQGRDDDWEDWNKDLPEEQGYIYESIEEALFENVNDLAGRVMQEISMEGSLEEIDIEDYVRAFQEYLQEAVDEAALARAETYAIPEKHDALPN